MAQLPSDNLFELAERKLQLLEQLQRLSADQAMLVNDQRVEELLCLLARKSEIVEALQSVQQQLQPFADQAPELREWQSPEKRLACRKVFDQINDRLQQLLMIDDYALNTLVQQREIVAGQISVTDPEALFDLGRPMPFIKVLLVTSCSKMDTSKLSDLTSLAI